MGKSQVSAALPTAIGICRYCDQPTEKFARSHIIPRSFYKIVRGDAKHAIRFEVWKDRIRTATLQAGEYDPGILCIPCEQEFTPFDTHGIHVLGKKPDPTDAYYDSDGILCGTYLRAADYNLLKLFVLSILWRAHVSTLPSFNRVDLGPHATRIRDILKSGIAPGQHDYSVIIIATVGLPFDTPIITPVRCKLGDVNCYQLFLPSLKLLVKVDKRPTPHPLEVLQIRPDATPIVPYLPYQGSYEQTFYHDMRQFMRAHGLLGDAKGNKGKLDTPRGHSEQGSPE